MKNIVVKLRKSPQREYSLQEVQDLKLLPWALDPRTVRKLIANDRKGSNLLQAKVKGSGKLRRYTLQATGIINYLNAYGPALMGTIRKKNIKK